MKLKLASLLAIIAATFTFGNVAKGDTIDYTFTGAGDYAGYGFTYVSTTGLLPLNGTIYTPTTETGGVTSFAFVPFGGSEVLDITAAGPIAIGRPVTGLDPTQVGTETLVATGTGTVEGTLVITDASAVPEINPQNAMTPLALLAGVILVIRGRRKVSAS
jgi:hypothetical protein